MLDAAHLAERGAPRVDERAADQVVVEVLAGRKFDVAAVERERRADQRLGRRGVVDPLEGQQRPAFVQAQRRDAQRP